MRGPAKGLTSARKGHVVNDLVAGVIRWALRLIVVAMGVVVFLSLLAAAALLAMVWGARALWARLAGKPVMPWTMRMDPRSGWSTVYRSTARWSAQSPAASTDDTSPGTRSRELPGAREVTDVEARELR